MVTYGLRELLMTLACHTDGTLLMVHLHLISRWRSTGNVSSSLVR
jgi:hypothetical protein